MLDKHARPPYNGGNKRQGALAHWIGPPWRDSSWAGQYVHAKFWHKLTKENKMAYEDRYSNKEWQNLFREEKEARKKREEILREISSLREKEHKLMLFIDNIEKRRFALEKTFITPKRAPARKEKSLASLLGSLTEAEKLQILQQILMEEIAPLPEPEEEEEKDENAYNY